MNILTIDNITKSYTERKLFERASFYLQEGEKAGIVGVNGSGKSTLLKIMAGLEEPDEGNVILANHVIIRYLPQNPVFDTEDSVLEAVVKENRTKENQWSIEGDAKTLLMQFGITDFHERCGHLSGGQRKRAALAAVLLSPADILILDEPTNHLDNQMADILEDILKRRRGAVVMVTHDRYFLDSVSNRIVEVNQGQIDTYKTNYAGYLALKAQREEDLLASERKRQSILKKELEWIKRGARARSTKQKARLERYEALSARQAPVTAEGTEMSSVSSRLGKTTVELSHIRKCYGEKVLIADFSYIFLKNDRVGLIGANGCGKTTLVKILTGLCEPDAGTIEIGQTVKIGYYAQEIADNNEKQGEIFYMDPKKRVIDYIKDVAEYVQTEEGSISASQMLERFLFSGSAQYGLIGKLSGGEKRRLNLLRVLMQAPNVLILDEPTNDLDIQTLTILEDYLDRFQGIVIVVSHDRYFLDRTVKRIFAFEEGGKLCQYEGGYTDYQWKKAVEEENDKTDASSFATISIQGKKEKEQSKDATKQKPRTRKLKFTYQEQKDYELIEEELEQIARQLEELETEMMEAARDFVKLNELTCKKEQLEQLQEEKMERWVYLEELAQRIANGEQET